MMTKQVLQLKSIDLSNVDIPGGIDRLMSLWAVNLIDRFLTMAEAR